MSVTVSVYCSVTLSLFLLHTQVEHLESVVEDLKAAMTKQTELVELSQMTAAAQMRSVESKYGLLPLFDVLSLTCHRRHNFGSQLFEV